MAVKTVIAGSDNVTAKQLKEVMHQIDTGVITGASIQNLLENAKVLRVKPLDLHHRLPSVLLLVKNGSAGAAVTDKTSLQDFVLSGFDFRIWNDIIMHAVNCARLSIESLDSGHDKYKAQFEKCFKSIDNAEDETELIEAVALFALIMANKHDH